MIDVGPTHEKMVQMVIENHHLAMDQCLTEILRQILKREPVPEDAKELTLARHPLRHSFDTIYSVFYGEGMIPLGTIHQSASLIEFKPEAKNESHETRLLRSTETGGNVQP